MNDFARVLRRLREEAGYKSPRAFYLDQGGRGFFRCTYRQYANVEYGRSLPSPPLFERVGVALRVANDGELSREFATAYLRALLGPRSVFEFVLRTLGAARAPAPDRWSPLRRAVEQSFKARAYPLSKAQTELIAGSPEGHWAFGVLAHDGGRWTPQALAAATGLSAAKLKKALEGFVALKLFAKDEHGAYFCRHHGRDFHMAKESFSAPRADALRRHLTAMGERHGGEEVVRYLCLRACESELRAYLPQAFDASYKEVALLSTDRKGEDTAFFQVETVFRKLLPL